MYNEKIYCWEVWKDILYTKEKKRKIFSKHESENW